MSAAPVLAHRGGFLFIFQSQQIPDRHAEVIGDLPGGGCVYVLLPAGLQIRDNSTADPQIRAEFAGGDAPLGAEGGDLIVYGSHVGRRVNSVQ